MPVLPFESDGQREAYERLKAPLEAAVGPVRERVHAIGYVYEIDGTIVTSTFIPWGADAVIANRCYLAGEVPMNADVLRQLATWTEAGRHGFYGVDDADNVYFEHQVIGSTATSDTLGRSIRHAHATAMGRRDEFRSRFGGGDL
jgi:hypothetical protein